MKNLICLITAIIFALSALNAQNSRQNAKRSSKLKENNYCVMLRDDNMVVVRKAGKAIEDNVLLTNGARINIDGSVIRKDGSLLLLNIGECVDNSGNPLPIRDFSIVMEAYRM